MAREEKILITALNDIYNDDEIKEIKFTDDYINFFE